MALIFRDTFTGTSGTLLDAHTPDTGTSWTKLVLVGTGDASLSGNELSFNSSGLGLDEGVLYTADATYSSADYEAHYTWNTADSDDDTTIIAVRIQDASNMYALRFSSTIFELYKCVGGSWSVIGTDLGAPADPGDVVKVQITGTTIKTYVNSTEQHSVTDSSHSAAGKAGVGSGAIIVSTDDASGARPDDFEVNTVDATTTSTSSTSSSISTSSTSVSTSSTSNSTSISTSVSTSSTSSSTSTTQSITTSTSSTSSSVSTSTTLIEHDIRPRGEVGVIRPYGHTVITRLPHPRIRIRR